MKKYVAASEQAKNARLSLIKTDYRGKEILRELDPHSTPSVYFS